MSAELDTRATLEAIAGELPGWKADFPYDHNGQLVSDDGVKLYCHVVTYGANRGRLEVSAGAPEGVDYSAGDYARTVTPKITVNPARGATAVARDITRRLIPDALEYWQTIAGRIARRKSAANAREVLASELAGIMGTTAREWRGEWQADIPAGIARGDGGTTYGDMTADYEGVAVTVTLRGLSAANARQVAELVRSWAS